jgi:hypothetical protein
MRQLLNKYFVGVLFLLTAFIGQNIEAGYNISTVDSSWYPFSMVNNITPDLTSSDKTVTINSVITKENETYNNEWTGVWAARVEHRYDRAEWYDYIGFEVGKYTIDLWEKSGKRPNIIISGELTGNGIAKYSFNIREKTEYSEFVPGGLSKTFNQTFDLPDNLPFGTYTLTIIGKAEFWTKEKSCLWGFDDKIWNGFCNPVLFDNTYGYTKHTQSIYNYYTIHNQGKGKVSIELQDKNYTKLADGYIGKVGDIINAKITVSDFDLDKDILCNVTDSSSGEHMVYKGHIVNNPSYRQNTLTSDKILTISATCKEYLLPTKLNDWREVIRNATNNEILKNANVYFWYEDPDDSPIKDRLYFVRTDEYGVPGDDTFNVTEDFADGYECIKDNSYTSSTVFPAVLRAKGGSFPTYKGNNNCQDSSLINGFIKVTWEDFTIYPIQPTNPPTASDSISIAARPLNVALTLPSCKILENKSDCISHLKTNFSWGYSPLGLSDKFELVKDGTIFKTINMLVDPQFEKDFTIPYGSQQTFSFNNFLLSGTKYSQKIISDITPTASCADGLAWNTLAGVCSKTTGTLTGADCQIAVGASTCNTTLNLSITNPINISSTTITDAKSTNITKTGNIEVANGKSPTAKPGIVVSYPSTTFYLNHFGNTLNPAGLNVKATCASGSWNSVNVKCTPNTTLPVVSNNTVTNITATSATIGATITSLGSPAATSGGMGYGTSPSSISDSTNGLQGTNLTRNLTGLTPNTTYYYNGFANNGGTGRSANSSFKTLPTIETYTITESHGVGGSVTPSGVSTVIAGSEITYNITPYAGYRINEIRVNGSLQTVSNPFTFTPTGNSAIGISFSAGYTITESHNSGGSVTPSGITNVTSGSQITYNITPSTGYVIKEIRVDGTVKPISNTYTFYPPQIANHTILVTFSLIAPINCSNGATNPTACTLCPDETTTTPLKSCKVADCLSPKVYNSVTGQCGGDTCSSIPNTEWSVEQQKCVVKICPNNQKLGPGDVCVPKIIKPIYNEN